MNTQVDLSKDQDHLLDDPEFSTRYSNALHRSCKINQRICDEAIPDHNLELIADLFIEELKLYGYTDQEIADLGQLIFDQVPKSYFG
ncbi:MAG: hypothetical protein C0623_02235 [Desulfuromonas sp.]|nr:MAG: hypothetical protein C0623_02235 [Desulfuromonas sp.]